MPVPKNIGRIAIGLFLVLAAAACSVDAPDSSGSAASVQAADGGDSRGAVLCSLLDDTKVQQSVADAMQDVLRGVVLESATATEQTCTQRYVAGDDWIEVTLHDQAEVDIGRTLDMGEGFATNGGNATSVTTSEGVIVAVARTSSPRSISTWDASMAAAFGLGGLGD